jgi:hypothetical protein
MGLDYVEEYPPLLRRHAVELSLRVQEWAIDVDALRAVCWRRIKRAGVEVRLNTRADPATTAGFDQVVVATYAALNDFPAQGQVPFQQYQFEVCEKPLVRLPAEYRGISMIVLDGPFACFDPVAATDTFLLGSVVHAIHATTVGVFPLIPPSLFGMLDRGLRRRPPGSKFRAIVADGSQFFAGFQAAEHLGSYFTVRTVLPGHDSTDARPTYVRRLDHRTTYIFSGKLATCVRAADDVVRLVHASTGVDTVMRHH